MYNDRVYILHFDVVSWDEADAVCKYNSASLAVLDTEEKADFMAQAVLETAPSKLPQNYHKDLHFLLSFIIFCFFIIFYLLLKNSLSLFVLIIYIYKD